MSNRILTTHVGSLPRPHHLLDQMKAKIAGENVDPATYDRHVSDAVTEIVRNQVENGIDIVTDGEMSKPGFFVYARERLAGFTVRPDVQRRRFVAEVDAFPEYYKDYFARAMLGGGVAPIHTLYCTGPVAYTGHAALQRDIANLRAALNGKMVAGAFMPSTAPSGVGENHYYKTEAEYLEALGEALREEYLAIVAAGFTLQVDDPFLSDIFADPELDGKARKKKAGLYVELLNHSLRGIPDEKIRYHTCYGINEGPRIHEAALDDVAGHMLRVKAAAYSFEAANCRHEHEYHLWEDLKLPAGKTILPGVITHASNIVEHPRLIAERLTRFAKRVGRDAVIASADCGFSSQATYKTEVNPKVIWAKFRAMDEGARLASEALWPRPKSVAAKSAKGRTARKPNKRAKNKRNSKKR
jgi:5-methyltetrahydropteroyltriglutamate--homocysteine methyltransferase